MQDFLNGLSSKLRLIRSEKHGKTLWIYCESELEVGKSVHSRVERVVKDINFGEYKVELHIIWKKYYNKDPLIDKTLVSERFDFIEERGRRTKRLDALLLSMQNEMSALGCERLVRESIADVSDSTMLRILKKTFKTNRG